MRLSLRGAHRAARGAGPLVACAALLLVAACGGSKHSTGNRPVNTRSSSGPVISNSAGGATAAPPAAGGVSRGTPPGGFALAPTPAATCGPTDLLMLVDKTHALPPDYVPPNLVIVMTRDASPGAPSIVRLRDIAAEALTQMLAAARGQGIYLLSQSGYRSYESQAQVYGAEVRNYGPAKAESESAQAGHSEHQLGLAMDFTSKALGYDLNDSFAATPEGKWLAQNAVKYGFVLSYPQGQDAATGYTYEPWHYRYLGVPAAQAFISSGMALNTWLTARQANCQP